jgi:hypothetical protein
MKHFLLAATALAMLSGTAYAQTSQSNSGSNAIVKTASGSQSKSVSNPKVNVIGNPIGNGASSSNSGAKATSNTRSASRAAAVGNTTNVTVSGYAGVDNSGNSSSTRSGGTGSSGDRSTGSTGDSSTGTTGGGSLNYGGSYTIRNTPEVIPPSVVGGNPCAVGASGGVALPGFGLALGGTWADKACERRQQAALMFNMGETKVAYELMCQDEHVHQAMVSSGKPCTADAVPVTQAQAATIPPPAAPVTVVAATAPAKPVRPEWCWTASKAELRGRAECDIK